MSMQQMVGISAPDSFVTSIELTTESRDITTDSSGNIYVCGYTPFTPTIGTPSGYVGKFDRNGNAIWQRTYRSSAPLLFEKIAVDSSGNVYVVGTAGTTANPANTDALIVKYNSSGTLQYQRVYYATGGRQTAEFGFDSIALDSSGNPHVVGYAFTTTGAIGTRDIFVQKLTTASPPVTTWIRRLGEGSQETYAEDIDVDSSGNVYVYGYEYTGTVYDAFVAKYNSSGTLQWTRYTRNQNVNTYSSYGSRIKVGSALTMFAVGQFDDGTSFSSRAYVLSLSTANATLNWQRIYQFTSQANSSGGGVSVDSDLNVYVAGRAANGAQDLGGVVKFNGSGTIQWARGLAAVTSEPFSLPNVTVAGITTLSFDTEHVAIFSNFDGAPTDIGQYNIHKYPITGGKSGVSGLAFTSTEAGFYDPTVSITYSIASVTVTPSTSGMSTIAGSLTGNNGTGITSAAGNNYIGANQTFRVKYGFF